jgi:hypothetical protein
MPRYYFDVKSGHRLIDPAGIIATAASSFGAVTGLSLE